MRKKSVLTGILMMAFAFGCIGMKGHAAPVENEIAVAQSAAQQSAATQPANPVYNADTDTTNWSYVYFGHYPQTKVTGDALTEEIVGANYNRDGEAIVDGIKYCRVEGGKYVGEPDYFYFRYEPVKWRVLQNTGSSLLLLSDSCLVPFEAQESVYQASKERSFLNQEFLEQAFYEAEQEILEIQQVEELGLSDLILLPTADMLTNTAYGFSPARDESMKWKIYRSQSRVLQTTDYTVCKIKRKHQNDQTPYWGYLFKSSDGIDTACLNDMGYTSSEWFRRNCLAPLIKININSNLWSMSRPADTFQVRDLSAVSVTLSRSSYVYDGTEKAPTVTVRDGSEVLEEGLDYTVSYSNNVNAGTASVTLLGSGDYANSKTVNFTIQKADQVIQVENSFTKVYGDAKFRLNATVTKGNGALDYVSDHEDVASVNSYGMVTVRNAGQAVITVSARETANYKPALQTVNVTVEKAEQEIQVESSFTSIYGDEPFELNPTLLKGNGAFTFSSDNPGVASVSDDGMLTVGNAGQAVITVTAEETANYKLTTRDVNIIVQKAEQEIQAASSVTKVYGDEAFELGARLTKGDGTFTYSSNDDNVVTVNTSGKVTVRNAGRAIITVTARETANYKSASRSIEIVVEKAEQEIQVEEEYTKVYGDAAFSLNPVLLVGNGKFAYSSDDEDVVFVSGYGTVTICGAGQAVITVTAQGTENYKSASRRVQIDVEKAEQIIRAASSYTRIVGDGTFEVEISHEEGDGNISFSSNNAGVANVDNWGWVEVGQPGQATITVTAEETKNYNAASLTVTVIVKAASYIEQDPSDIGDVKDPVYGIPSMTQKKTLQLHVNSTDISSVYSSERIPIGVNSTGNGVITFWSENPDIASVDAGGNVTMWGYGRTFITVTLTETGTGRSITQKVTVTVKPKRMTLKKVKAKGKRKLMVQWTKDTKASGYELMYSGGGRKKTVTVRKNRAFTTIKSLKSRTRYSIKVRSYTLINGKRVYGQYSKVKKVRAK